MHTKKPTQQSGWIKSCKKPNDCLLSHNRSRGNVSAEAICRIFFATAEFLLLPAPSYVYRVRSWANSRRRIVTTKYIYKPSASFCRCVRGASRKVDEFAEALKRFLPARVCKVQCNWARIQIDCRIRTNWLEWWWLGWDEAHESYTSFRSLQDIPSS